MLMSPGEIRTGFLQLGTHRRIAAKAAGGPQGTYPRPMTDVMCVGQKQLPRSGSEREVRGQEVSGERMEAGIYKIVSL